MKKTFTILFLLITGWIFAQENIFWDRDYWSPKTTLKDVKAKIKAGNDPTALTQHGFDAPAYAILGDAPDDVIIYLLGLKGNDINKITHDARTYLFWSAYQGNYPITEYLLKNGARMDVLDDKGNPIFLFSTLKGHNNTKIYDLLLANGASISETNPKGANALLYGALGAKDINALSYFLDKGLSLQSTDKNGYNVVDYAAKVGNKALIKQLIKKGASYKDTNKDGSNAILLASKGYRHKVNHLDFFKYLESLGINPNVIDNEGVTPLHNLAYKSDDTDLFTYFIEKGINPNQADKKGNTPLMNASYNNKPEVVAFFAEKTNDINAQNAEGKSALTNAVYRNKPEVVSYLIEKGANPLIVDKKGNSLAYYLIASYSPKNKDNFNKKWELLAQNRVNFDTLQADGNTLFHLAVDKNDVDLLRKIAQLGIDINAKNNDGLTALHKAVMISNDTKIIKELLALGANPSIKTDFGETVYDLAKENELLNDNEINFLNVN